MTSQQGIIGKLALYSLSHLAEELKYGRAHDRSEDKNFLLLRRLCVQLARCMAQSGYEDHPVVGRWLEDGKTDPFPEVRYEAASPANSTT